VLPSLQKGLANSLSCKLVWGVSVLLGQQALLAVPQLLGRGRQLQGWPVL
jgi:hypothetical protein